MLLLLDFMQPSVKCRFGNAQMFGDSVPWNLKDFHVRENEHLFPERISFVGVFLMKPFLKNGNLHLLLINSVAEEDDLLVFLVDLHFRQPFQASFAGSS